MKNILVLVHDDEGQEARLRVAVTVAQALDAHLTCLHETMIPECLGDYAAHGAPMLALGEEGRERANGSRVYERMAREAPSCSWIDVTSFAAQGIQQHLRLVDLAILSRRLASRSPDMMRLAEELLRKARKPLLLVPPDVAGIDLDGTAVVAWDGSSQAEAALIAAVPLLRHAANVTVLHVDDGSLEVPAEEAARYLAREGAIVSVVARPLDDRSIARTLIDAVRERGASYLVAGAYRRGAAWERLFGGVTRTLIAHSPVPLLLVH